MMMEKVQFSELPEKIFYLKHSDGSAEARLRRNIQEVETDDGVMWTATEVFIPHTMLTVEELDGQFDTYFYEEPETTIADLTEAIDILTEIVLGGM